MMTDRVTNKKTPIICTQWFKFVGHRALTADHKDGQFHFKTFRFIHQKVYRHISFKGADASFLYTFHTVINAMKFDSRYLPSLFIPLFRPSFDFDENNKVICASNVFALMGSFVGKKLSIKMYQFVWWIGKLWATFTGHNANNWLFNVHTCYQFL